MVNAIFIIVGLAILTFAGWMAKSFFISEFIPLFLKILVGVVVTGGVTLILIVVRDRMKQAKDEDFKGVDK